MVSAQADCTLDEALILMQTRAATSQVTLEAIAVAILARSIRFDD